MPRRAVINSSLSDHPSWKLEEGDEIVEGLYALELLGGGNTYEAYLSWSDDLFALLVAKLVRPHLVENERSIKQLETEAETLMKLAHPGLVRGFGAELGGDKPHILMEHLEGPALSTLIRKYGKHGGLPLEQTLPLAMHICGVIAYLERQSVAHLDIKPRNIIMGVPPRLIDLSVARTFERAKRITGHVGTDLYMAPEQCEPGRRGLIGPAADVWGLGATFYHAATGHVPFSRPKVYNRENLYERFPQLVNEMRPFPKGFPRDVGEVILMCLQRDPEERPKPRDLALELEPLIESLPKRRILRKLRPTLG